MAEKKKFCTNCGKQLKNGEECTCQKEVKQETTSSNDFVALAKGFLDDIINMYKKPATTIKEKVKEANTKNALIMLGVMAVVSALCTLLPFIGLSDYVEVPYLKIFIYVLLLVYGFAFIPVLVAFETAKILKNDKFDFNKSLSLYVYSFCPTVLVTICSTLLTLANIKLLTYVAILASAVVSLACAVTYVKEFLNNVEIKDDMVAKVISLMTIAMIVISAIILYLIGEKILGDIIADMGLGKYLNFLF